MLPTNYSLRNHIYKQDMGLNNYQGLIYHKTQPNQTKPNSILTFMGYLMSKPFL